ncbi:MAG: hypothetical protein U0412_05925 [Nitrospira sp.]
MQIERLIAVELLVWPCEAGVTVPHGLAEMLRQDRSVVPLMASQSSVACVLHELARYRAASGIVRRGLVCDLAATISTPR